MIVQRKSRLRPSLNFEKARKKELRDVEMLLGLLRMN